MAYVGNFEIHSSLSIGPYLYFHTSVLSKEPGNCQLCPSSNLPTAGARDAQHPLYLCAFESVLIVLC